MDISNLSAETLGTAGGLGFIVAILVELLVKPALKKRGIDKNSETWGMWVFGIAVLLSEALAFLIAVVFLGPLTASVALSTAVLGFSGGVIGSGLYEGFKNALRAANSGA